jgi:ribosomal protein S18 acetylase RimI-like enzyme
MRIECMEQPKLQVQIKKTDMTSDIEKLVEEGFRQHAIEKKGFDGGITPFTFVAYEDKKIVGIIDCKFFWGALHIRWLFVCPGYRKQGIGTSLMNKAEAYAREHNCSFAYVETMSFHALEFYKKLGFKVDLCRSGYALDTSFYYLRKDY